MRYLLSLLLLAATCWGSKAQTACCPYLTPVQVLPTNPSATTPVRLVSKVTLPALGIRVSAQARRSNDTLYFTNCYTEGMAAALVTLTDTVQVGLLPAGRYVISFVARISATPQLCVETRRNSAVSSFQVGTALANRSPAASWALYPTPAVGRQLQLRAPSAMQLQSVQLMDMAGRNCFMYPAARLTQPAAAFQLDLPPLPAGVYLLQVQPAEGPASRQRIVLE